MLAYNIKNLKAHIKHHEKHGKGLNTIKEKQQLLKAEHILKIRKENA